MRGQAQVGGYFPTVDVAARKGRVTSAGTRENRVTETEKQKNRKTEIGRMFSCLASATGRKGGRTLFSLKDFSSKNKEQDDGSRLQHASTTRRQRRTKEQNRTETHWPEREGQDREIIRSTMLVSADCSYLVGVHFLFSLRRGAKTRGPQSRALACI